MTQLRHLTSTIRPAAVRTEYRAGREYRVAPVVAMVGDSVIQPMGSQGPELVPASVLEESAASWDGLPILSDHPTQGGELVSASDPGVSEALSFGFLDHTRFSGGRLKSEVWIDVARAQEMGGDAWQVVERIDAGELVEVSIGATVGATRQDGIAPGGQKYEYVWATILRPDHLAILPEGTTGACSVSAGCGMPRAARGEAMKTNDGKKPEAPAADPANEPKPKPAERLGILERFASFVRHFPGLRAAEPTSDVDLRNALYDALRAVEPGFDGVSEVYASENTVIYWAIPEDRLLWLRRTYSLDESGEVSLSEDREEVEPRTEYVPVGAADAADPAGCQCNSPGRRAAAAEPARDASDPDRGDDMSKIKDLVGRLVACEASPFTEADEETLAAFGEERLTALAESFAGDNGAGKGDTIAPAEPVPAAPDPNTVPVPREEYEDMKAATAAWKAQVTQRRGELIGAITEASSEYTAEELEGETTAKLEKLARALRAATPAVRDYSLAADPVAGADEVSFAPPDTYGLVAAQKAREAGSTKGVN